MAAEAKPFGRGITREKHVEEEEPAQSFYM